MYRFRYFLIALFFLPLAVYAEGKSITKNINVFNFKKYISCSEEGPRILMLNLGHAIYHLHMPEILETNVIKSDIVCSVLIDRFNNATNIVESDITLTLFPATINNVTVPVYRFSYQPLYDFCFSEGLCSRSLRDKLVADKQLKNCQVKQSLELLKTKLAPKLKRANYQYIPQVKIRHHPRTTFLSELIDLSNRAEGNSTFIATMNLGGLSLIELGRKTKRRSAPLFIATDAGLLLKQNSRGHFLNTLAFNPALKVIPITTGYSHSLNFHWKILFNKDQEQTMMSSLNLSNPGNVPYLDLFYKFNDKNVNKELKNRLYLKMDNQCKQRQDFKCMADFLERDKNTFKKWEKLITDSCKALEREELKTEFNANSGKYFLAAGEDDIEFLINNLIKNAKKDIFILTHKFNVDSIYKQLSKAKQKGLAVNVFHETDTPFNETDFIYRIFRHPKQRAPAPHLKVMLIDQDTLFFGNGNFTYSGLLYSDELFGLTKDKDAIDYVKSIIDVYLKAVNPSHNKFLASSIPEEPWLFIPADYPNKSSLDSELAKFIVPLEGDMLRHYRKFTPSGTVALKACGLDRLLYVGVGDFRKCVGD